MSCSLSLEEKLKKRINREFPKKKLIGDIVISDEEFGILISYLRSKYRRMYNFGQHIIIDPTFCVALVQIGIREYDGNYWSHVKRLLDDEHFNANHQEWLGSSFIATMMKFEKLQLGKSDRVNTILMHGFVSNIFAKKFFNFLFAFYSIDLFRDISRLDRAAMSGLIDNMKCNDNTGRTYMLVEHTADAVRNNSRGCKTRIRRYLKLIDKAFWDEELPENSPNRLIRQLFAWKDSSEEFHEGKRNEGTPHRGKKSFSSPYIQYIGKNDTFWLILPPQIISFHQNPQNLSWSIEINEKDPRIKISSAVQGVTCYKIGINPTVQGVTGYKSDEVTLNLPCEDLFESIDIYLKDGDNEIRHFKIVREPIRFFDIEGFYVRHDVLRPGQVFSFTPLNFKPESEAKTGSEHLGDLLLTSFDLRDGDIIRFPDGKLLSVHWKIQEGFIPRGVVNGAIAVVNNEKLAIYSTSPIVFIKVLPQRIPGTAIKINSKIVRVYENQTLVTGVSKFDLFDDSGESGYLFDLSRFGCNENGVYDISIDIPNDIAQHHWQFVLVNGLTYHFEDAPYIFKTRGTLCISKKFGFTAIKSDPSIEMEDQSNFNFEIAAGESYFFLNFRGIHIGFEIPALSYHFEEDKWQIMPHKDIWYTSFQPHLFIKYHTDKLKIYLDDDEGTDHHSESFTKIQSKDVFECELNRFRSWFRSDSNKKKRQVFLKLPDIEKPIPLLNVVIKSTLNSGHLECDLDRNRLIGVFDITGQATYYVDLYFKKKLFANKIPLTEGRFDIESELKSGDYEAHIFEAEKDDSGFGKQVYYYIGKITGVILNPYDLNGMSIVIKSIRPTNANSGDSDLLLGRTYKVKDIQKYKDNKQDKDNQQDKVIYCGEMIVGVSQDNSLVTIPVHIGFYNLKKLCYSHITFYDEDEGDFFDFLYDDVMRFIVKEEEKNITKLQAYRRYEMTENYTFMIEFLNSDN